MTLRDFLTITCTPVAFLVVCLMIACLLDEMGIWKIR